MRVRAWGCLAVAGACGGTTPSDVPDEVELREQPVERMAARRLTRAEYGRSLRDLLGVAGDPGANLPVDDATDGFDSVAEGLVVSPILVELWEKTASRVLSEALHVPLAAPFDVRIEAEAPGLTATSEYGGVTSVGYLLASGGALEVPFVVPETGRYRLSAWVWGDQGGDDLVQASLGVAFGAVPAVFEVAADRFDAAERIDVEVDLLAGPTTLQVAFLNDAWIENELDLNLHVDAVQIWGPVDFTPKVNPLRAKLVTCEPSEAPDPRACLRTIVSDFARRAWRRPVSTDEVDALMGLADGILDAGDSTEWALEFVLRAVLTSPHFTFLVEPSAVEGVVDDHVLASRLSYLLWSSVPDDTLLALADEGRLHEPAVLIEQVDRMIADERSLGFVQDFAGQWLMIRALGDSRPDLDAYLGFTDDMRASMSRSMELFFRDLLTERRPVTDLLTSPYLFIDNRLRLWLGLISGPTGEGEWQRIDVGGQGRQGWLTQPGLLTATSYPTRTSPVKRGVWVVSNLLCDEPEPPPPGVEGFPEADGEAVTVRERMEAHRSSPVCNSCHAAFDPVGLAFEHFDGVGRRREFELGQPVDATGELPDGTLIDGVADLARALVADDRFSPCVVEKLFTYAHRRPPTADDEPFLHEIQARYETEGGTLRDLVVALVTSETFSRPGVPAIREVTP